MTGELAVGMGRTRQRHDVHTMVNDQEGSPGRRAEEAVVAARIPYTVTEHGPVSSLEEAAAARGLTPDRVLKSIVVRRSEGDYVFVLVPGGRTISWPKLRAKLGVSRLSLPDANAAFEATGYVRGTITPFGSAGAWPVVADASIAGGPVSIGGGVSGRAFTVDFEDLVAVLGAEVADVTEAAAD